MHQRTWLSLLTLPLVVAFTVPMFHRQAPKPVTADSGAVSTNDPLAGLADIQDVLAHIRTNYVDVPDMEKALAGGIQGALERVNLLNSYLTPTETQQPAPDVGETGLTLLKTQIFAIVIGVAPGSPAAAAGFQVGDRVRKLDGESLESMSHWAMERKLRGPVGSEIALVRMPAGSTEQKKAVLKREKPQRPGIASRVEPGKAIMVALPDLTEGRAKELSDIFSKFGTKLPLIIDLRTCTGGSYEEAAVVASMLGCSGVFATLQETGQPDRPLNVQLSESDAFPKIAVLLGVGTVGPAEALAVAIRRIGDRADEMHRMPRTVISLGERTIGLAVERRRFPLKQGGAVELVTRRWLGADGERLDKTGPAPDYSLRGIPATEDILPRILEALESRSVKSGEETHKVARLKLNPSLYPAFI
ncbi:MAG: PDZ domain-containing protein [Holophagales bacterium]|nr:PDZ domain-containing protein [Holophagales bacterium]